MNKIAVCLIIILGSLMMLDVVTTHIALENNHTEKNPIMNLIVSSPINHVMLKIIGLILIILCSFIFKNVEIKELNKKRDYYCMSLTICCIFYICVVSNNIIQIIIKTL
ncbi:MAG: hypothetical protein MCSN_6160 [Candidatus Microsyncoccus archaeolyticus]|nr:MAG: hypothetical protein MCSN_6160 [Candidatus Parcubacteria bacterium]